MKHPAIMVLPVVMLADYYLTLVGAKLYREKYGQHIKLEQYELNPNLQSSVSTFRWFNPRYILFTIAATLSLVLLGYVMGTDEMDCFIIDFCLGLLLSMFLLMVGRHVSSILTFRYAMKHPDCLAGEARFSYEMSLKMSQYEVNVALFPLVSVLLISPTAFALGAFCSLIIVMLVHYAWLAKYRKLRGHRESDPNR